MPARRRCAALLLGAVATLGLAGTAHGLAARAADENATAQRAAKAVLPDVPLTSDIFYRVLAAESPAARTDRPLLPHLHGPARDTRDRASPSAPRRSPSVRGSRNRRSMRHACGPTSRRARDPRAGAVDAAGTERPLGDAEPLLAHQLAETPASQRPEAILQLQQQLAHRRSGRRRGNAAAPDGQ